MKSKRYILGSAATGAVFCALLTFNSAFSSCLIIVPEKPDMQSVIAEPIASAEHLKPAGDTPDINAIPEMQAIKIALEILEESYWPSRVDIDFLISMEPYINQELEKLEDRIGEDFSISTEYVKGVAPFEPFNDSIWVVTFKSAESRNYSLPQSYFMRDVKVELEIDKVFGKEVVSLEEKYNELLEERNGAIERIDEDGDIILDFGEITEFVSISINAFTGEKISIELDVEYSDVSKIPEGKIRFDFPQYHGKQ